MGTLIPAPSAPLAQSDAQFVSFMLGTELFGVNIREVKEITPALEVLSVPRAPTHVRGLVNVRGQVVLVLDVAAILGRPPSPMQTAQQLVILKTQEELQLVHDLDPTLDREPFGDKPVSVLVDELQDVVHTNACEIKAVPPHIPQQTRPFFSGVVQLPHRLLVILALTKLLAYRGHRIP